MAKEGEVPRFSIPDFGNIDLSKLSQPRGSNSNNNEPDFILSSHKRGRDTMGQLVFNTGVCWLGGFVGGGLFGAYQGWRGAASPNMKLRINGVMNGLSSQGSRAGNALGVIGEK